ncbi:MAG TPA: glucosamine-6-phosphate deaminase [Clostridiales bacterium]|nr:glucosamine-6-phosphate deaminase [Clostridia bacterium]MDD4680279.1 glucosamine-6-phosphate deaminase [Clostridia bacterium]HCS73954.1 glucosamine-6-phosphate deaminase [Clostridiales bacterium]
MNLFIGTAEECDQKGAHKIIQQIKEKPNTVLGLATGSTPIGMYRNLVKSYRANEVSFSQVRTYNLDEYVGIPQDHPCSYYYFMQENLFKDIDIPAENVSLPNGNAEDLAAECKSYEERITAAGGIDLQVLGIGHNGHIGFNEPGTPFGSVTQLIDLTQSTIQANSRFFENEDQVPRQALSMGIKTIMQARKILLFAKGGEKAEIMKKALQGPVTPEVPASILQLHPNLFVFVDKAAGAKL